MKDFSLIKLKEYVGTAQGKRWIILLGTVGCLLLLLPKLAVRTPEKPTAVQTAESFAEETEKRLMAIIGDIDGAGRCRVMVTLENGVEYVYATEERNNSDRSENLREGDTLLTERDDSESSVIVVETEDGRDGLLVTELQPTVRGVVVVCEGGDDEAVRTRIEKAVTVALNISPKRVCITKLS